VPEVSSTDGQQACDFEKLITATLQFERPSCILSYSARRYNKDDVTGSSASSGVVNAQNLPRSPLAAVAAEAILPVHC
jgi:hypothetical protein